MRFVSLLCELVLRTRVASSSCEFSLRGSGVGSFCEFVLCVCFANSFLRVCFVISLCEFVRLVGAFVL